MSEIAQQQVDSSTRIVIRAAFFGLLIISAAVIIFLYASGFYDGHRSYVLWTGVFVLMFWILLPFSVWLWLRFSKKEAAKINVLGVREADDRVGPDIFVNSIQNTKLSFDKQWIAVLGTHQQQQAFFGVEDTANGYKNMDSVILILIDQANIPENLHLLRGRFRKPVDAIINLLDEEVLLNGFNFSFFINTLTEKLKWAVPVYGVLNPKENFPPLKESPICHLLNARSEECNEVDLHNFSKQLAQVGVYQLSEDLNDFALASLSQRIGRDSQKILETLTLLTKSIEKKQILRFLAWHTSSKGNFVPLLDAVAADCRLVTVSKLKFSSSDILGWFFVGAVAAWLTLLAMSFSANYNSILNSKQTLISLKQAKSTAVGVDRLFDLQTQLQDLDFRIENDAPLRMRVGLNQDHALLQKLLPVYGKETNRLLAKPIQMSWQKTLNSLNDIPLSGDLNNSALVSDNGYRILKAYLMLDQPVKTQASFLAQQLSDNPIWTDIKKQQQVVQYYVKHLAQQPSWRIAAEKNIVQDARQTLLTLRGIEQGDEMLYKSIMQKAAAKYPPRNLASLMAGVDVRGVFMIPTTLPGEFTRQAWDAYVKEAIDTADPKQDDEAGWVLGTTTVKPDASQNTLRDRLQRRYFSDYASAWQQFLNNLQWQLPNTMPATINQLHLVTDPQRSPVVALIEMVQYQGQAGQVERSISKDLIDKTRELVGKVANKNNTVNQVSRGAEQSGTLVVTKNENAQIETSQPEEILAHAFEPILQLTDSNKGDEEGRKKGFASLNRYLATVAAVRLKMQQIANAPDPDAAARQFALLIFKDQPNELAEAQKYAALLTASMGTEWAVFAQQMFVKPLDQSSNVVLIPAAANLNDMWRLSVQLPWANELSGRFPFNNTDSDASLPRLANYIAPEQGTIARFINQYLSGALEQVGDQWVPSPTMANAGQFDADFLNAINELGRISSQLFSQGEAGFRFELMPIASAGLVQTTLTIDGQVLDYFNQQQGWHTLNWPGDAQKPGTRLTWVSVATGTQKTLDFSGRWSFLRLLARAKIEQLDKSNYQLDFDLSDGLHMRYILRTENGKGPLSLLKLLQFKMPTRVFLGKSSSLSVTKPNDTKAQ